MLFHRGLLSRKQGRAWSWGRGKDCFNIRETWASFYANVLTQWGRGMSKLERRGSLQSLEGRRHQSRAVGSGGGARGASGSADEIVKTV